MTKKKTTVISLGGSLIVPEGGIDTAFVRKFRALINRRARAQRRFVLVTGGGTVCRQYQRAASKVRKMTLQDLDWLGIHVTRLNAQFMRLMFGDKAHKDIVTDPTAPIRVSKPVVIGAGWKPGCSTDYDAVLLAKRFGADTLINLTNTDYVYDSDPRRNKSARPIREISWKEYRKMFGTKWVPGLNSPFDPIAAGMAQRLGLKVLILNGRKLKNLEAALDGKKFTGTVIG
jgi:uridylate kinase